MNVRSLKGNENLVELKEAFRSSKFNIVAMAEVKREGNKIITIQEGNFICYAGNKREERSVGFPSS